MFVAYIVLLLCASHSCDLIKDVAQETRASLIVIRYDYCEEQWLQRILVEAPLPVVLQSLRSHTATSKHFSRVLQIICLPSADYQLELENVRGPKSIFYVVERQQLQLLLWQCYKLRMLNIIALPIEDSESYYYRYQPYPQFKVEQRALVQRPFFVTHLGNMQQQPLIVLPDQKHPRTIVYRDWRTGKQILGGSVGRFVRTLAWRLNASIEIPKNLKPELHYTEMLELMEKHHVDVPAAAVPLHRPEQLPLVSYPFELIQICLMIPISQQLPIKQIYLILYSVQHILIAMTIVYSFGILMSLHTLQTGEATSWVNLMFNDVALRGLLGQSFGQFLRTSLYISWIYLMLACLGLNTTSLHDAALGTLLTQPPKAFQPRSFADVIRVQLPLVVNVADMANSVTEIDPDLNRLPVNASFLNSQRDKMNTSHAYFSSRIKWSLLSEQQKYFPHEVFLYSMDACVVPLGHMVFHLPKNTWFLDTITKLIMDTRDFGFMQYWIGMHFYDMAAAGLMSFSDPIKRMPHRTKAALRLADLQWIWIGYGTLLMLATIVLVLEILVKRAMTP